MVQLRIVAFFGTRRFIAAVTSATLRVVYLFHQIMLIFKVISEHIDIFVRSWQEFKNSFTLNVGLLLAMRHGCITSFLGKNRLECSLDH